VESEDHGAVGFVALVGVVVAVDDEPEEPPNRPDEDVLPNSAAARAGVRVEMFTALGPDARVQHAEST